MKQVTRGSAVRFRGRFQVSDVDTDPSTVSIQVRDPSGTTSTYTYGSATISKEATGIYYKDIVLDSEGVWKAYMVGTGLCRAADIEAVQCRPDPFV